MKPVLIGLLLLLIGAGAGAEEKPKSYPEKPTKEWKALSDEEQYKLFKSLMEEYDGVISSYKALSQRYDAILVDRYKLKTAVERNRYGVFAGTSLGIDERLALALNIHLGFRILFKRYFMTDVYLLYKPWMNNGGGIGFNFGLIF